MSDEIKPTLETEVRVGGRRMSIRGALSMNRKERRAHGFTKARGLNVPYNKAVEKWDEYKKRTTPPEEPSTVNSETLSKS